MARIAPASTLIREASALRVGTTMPPGSSSQQAYLRSCSTTASEREETDEFYHHLNMLNFIAAYMPHPGFAVGCMYAFWLWCYRNLGYVRGCRRFLDTVPRHMRCAPQDYAMKLYVVFENHYPGIAKNLQRAERERYGIQNLTEQLGGGL